MVNNELSCWIDKGEETFSLMHSVDISIGLNHLEENTFINKTIKIMGGLSGNDFTLMCHIEGRQIVFISAKLNIFSDSIIMCEIESDLFISFLIN
jgi:hypothetical protein